MLNQEFRVLRRKYQVLPNFGTCCSKLRGLKVTSFHACVGSFCSVFQAGNSQLSQKFPVKVPRFLRFGNSIPCKLKLWNFKGIQLSMHFANFKNCLQEKQEYPCPLRQEHFRNLGTIHILWKLYGYSWPEINELPIVLMI